MSAKANFDELLKTSGLSKTDLAMALGMRPDTMYRWRDAVPTYVTAYLELVVEIQQLKSYINGAAK